MARTPPKLSDLGESELIARIARRAGRPPGPDWALGIGDDAAILRTRADSELVFSTDAQIEDVHFRFGRDAPRTIGRRAVVASLSDLAAMGASPVGILLNLAAPTDARVSTFDAIVAGFVDEAARHGCPLVGGNLARAERFSLDMTVIGRCESGRALTRRGLRPGDGLYVTGELGQAALARMRADRSGGRLGRVQRPRLAAGRVLAGLDAVRACIDLSDGLATDLPHLLATSGLGAEIDADCLPRAQGFDRGCRALGLDPLELLVAGGEDYELLFAFREGGSHMEPRELTRRLGTRATRIGRVEREPGVRGLAGYVSAHHF